MPEVSETLKGSPLQNFSALWDNKFSTENLDTSPLSDPNFFDTRN